MTKMLPAGPRATNAPLISSMTGRVGVLMFPEQPGKRTAVTARKAEAHIHVMIFIFIPRASFGL
jgi:hypothetical protein